MARILGNSCGMQEVCPVSVFRINECVSLLFSVRNCLLVSARNLLYVRLKTGRIRNADSLERRLYSMAVIKMEFMVKETSRIHPSRRGLSAVLKTIMVEYRL